MGRSRLRHHRTDATLPARAGSRKSAVQLARGAAPAALALTVSLIPAGTREAAGRTASAPVYAIAVPAQNYFNDAEAAAAKNDDQAALWLHYTSPATPTVLPGDFEPHRVIDTWRQPVMWML